MLVDLSKQKVKVKLKYLIPKDIIFNLENYGELETEVTIQELFDKTGMTLKEYHIKEPPKSKQLSLPFNYKSNKQETKTSHFVRLFNQTSVAKFTL